MIDREAGWSIANTVVRKKWTLGWRATHMTVKVLLHKDILASAGFLTLGRLLSYSVL